LPSSYLLPLIVLAFFDFPSSRIHFLVFILSFGKFWPAWQKKFTGRRADALSPKRCCGECNRLRKAPQPFNDPVIRVYDDAGNLIETHDHVGGFRER
jgi:hypothetical protein